MGFLRVDAIDPFVNSEVVASNVEGDRGQAILELVVGHGDKVRMEDVAVPSRLPAWVLLGW